VYTCIFFNVVLLAIGERSSKIKVRGNRMQPAGRANVVPLGPFKNDNGYANNAMPLGSPALFV
jgi:hypothetical protein